MNNFKAKFNAFLSNKVKPFILKDSTKSVISSLACIVGGLLIGFLFMLIISFTQKGISVRSAFKGLKIIFQGPFYSGYKSDIGDMLFYSVPIILTGLSVTVAYKTGLFNIGASGQFTMGTVGCLLVALNINSSSKFTGILVWVLAVIVGIIFAGLWGTIPGIVKAYFDINEVIICIMCNWIAAVIGTWAFAGSSLRNVAGGKSGYLITTKVTGNGTPTLGFDKLFNGSYLDMGIIIAIIVAIIIYILMNKTTFGYELKACGANKHAAKYAGMNEKRNIILSMGIAGALAGLGACLYYLNPGIEYAFNASYQKLPSEGFTGIPVALLASCNPIAVIFSGLFIKYIASGGQYLSSANFNQYIADIVIALIIYFSGFSKLIKDLLKDKNFKKLGFEPKKKEVPSLASEGNKDSIKKEEEK